MDKISHPRQIRSFNIPFRSFLSIHIFQFRIFIRQRAKTHKQHKSYTRDALMGKNSHPRWMGSFSRPFRDFLLIHIFQFQIFILQRAKTHKQHKSYTREALMDKNSHPRWMGGVSVDPLKRHLRCNFCTFYVSLPFEV